jgi:hypothetical protein
MSLNQARISGPTWIADQNLRREPTGIIQRDSQAPWVQRTISRRRTALLTFWLAINVLN